jgi:type VI secretion system protein ImpG
MQDSLLNYYEQELTFIRKMGEEFAKRYPKIAGRLLLEPDKCEDPHTERLIEAFALFSGRIRKKIDDDLPEITESLFHILYPHYISPIPSMSIVRLEPIKKNLTGAGYTVPKHTVLFSRPVASTPCQFTTVYPVTLWPVEVAAVELREDTGSHVKEAHQILTMRLKTYNNIHFPQMAMEKLRFFLNGPSQHIYHLYELLLNNVVQLECEWANKQGKTQRLRLPPESIQPAGFEADEEMIPRPRRSFPGYMLLLEYFCFPEKFLFLDLKGLNRFAQLEIEDTVDIHFYLNRSVKSDVVVNEKIFCLNATPVINLFKRVAEPIQVDYQKTEYHVIPDVRRPDTTEVFRIDGVSSTSASDAWESVDFKPFYSLRHHLDEDEASPRAFWHLERRLSGRKEDEGTEIYLSFTDLEFNPADPGVDVLIVHVTCTNRDLPARLPFGDPSGDFDMEVAAPVSQITCVLKPTPTRRSSLGGALQWRLISHLSLNYLSILEGGQDALKEILRLYDFDNSPVTRQQIEGIVSLASEHVTKRIDRSFCRGVRVTVDFNEDKFVGSGLYLFSSILERFLGLYVSVNAFSQLVARTTQRKEAFKVWPPRAGNRVLL